MPRGNGWALEAETPDRGTTTALRGKAFVLKVATRVEDIAGCRFTVVATDD